jgi:predicted Rossmann fold flavoprotein
MTADRGGYDVAVIGGGAAGIVAAISARRKGARVLLLEKTLRLGKKVLATGAGRCNILNDTVDASFYNPEAKSLVTPVLDRFGKKEILHFFKELGLRVYSDGGKLYPVTNQAASVMEVLTAELERLGMETVFQSEVTGISKAHDRFTVNVRPDKRFTARAVVVCGGGKSYPSFGADGGAYKFFTHLGHKLVEPVPSTVSLLVKDHCCHTLQGQKIKAAVAGVIDGREVRRAEGDLLFTKYGLSGTAILDISEDLSIAINRQGKKHISVVTDLVPFIGEEELKKELMIKLGKKFAPDKLLIGLLPHKFAGALSEILRTKDAGVIAAHIKNKRFPVDGTRGWNEAEFTAGGIDTNAFDPATLESKLCRGVYAAGEILNVQGRRGGYNLAWAWASGHIAGESAAAGK